MYRLNNIENEIKQANSTSFENSDLISISKDTLLNKITLPSLLCVHTLQHVYISQLGRFHDSSDWLWLPKLNHASPLYYPRGIRVQVPKQNGIKALDGLMVTTMLVPGIARISAIPSPSLLEIRFPSNYANKWSRTGKNAAPLSAGRKRNRELDFFARFATKEETMEETVGRLRSDYSRLLQF